MKIRMRDGVTFNALTVGIIGDAPMIMIIGQADRQGRTYNARPLTQAQAATLGAIACMIPSSEIGPAIDAARRYEGSPLSALDYVERQREIFSGRS